MRGEFVRGRTLVAWPRSRMDAGHLIYLAVLGSLVIGAGWWLAHHIGRPDWSADEGMHLMWAQMTRAGYPLYSVTWADQPPGLVVSLSLMLATFGPSLAVARAVPIAYALLGLIGVAWTVRELDGGRLASLVAPAILLLTPDFFWLSRVIVADMPAMALATLALAASLHYLRTGRRRWLVVAGLCFGLGLSLKLLVAPLLFPLALVVLLRA